jgi:hypothetical protein
MHANRVQPHAASGATCNHAIAGRRHLAGRVAAVHRVVLDGNGCTNLLPSSRKPFMTILPGAAGRPCFSMVSSAPELSAGTGSPAQAAKRRLTCKHVPGAEHDGIWPAPVLVLFCK